MEKCRAIFCPSSIRNINRSINYFDLISTTFTLYSSMVEGTNIQKMAGDDQPVLCNDKVRFIGDPVTAVVATSE